MKVLITGANGYLGANLVDFFLQQKAEVYGLVRSLPPDSATWQSQFKQLVVGDIRQTDTVDQLTQLEPDYIIHTVSLDHNLSQTADSGTVLAVNVQPTLELLNLFTAKGLKKFIYFSTQQVYGRLQPVEIAETYPTQPANIYGLTHLMSENICNYFNTTTKTTCINIRLSNSIGKPVFAGNNCWWLVVNDFCRSARQNQSIKILSDGTPQRDFITIQDVCAAVQVLLQTAPEQLVFNTFNLGKGKTYTIAEVAQTVARIYHDRYGQELPLITASNEPFCYQPPANFDRFYYNTQRLNQLGFYCQQSLEDGIQDVFNYLDSSGA